MHISEAGGLGAASISVVIITLNEVRNMEAVLANLKGWAQAVFVGGWPANLS